MTAINKLKAGWIGLGNMGNPMVKNLLKAGFEVSVFNRNRSKEDELLALGATSASSPRQLMETCDIIFTMLSDDAAVKHIFEYENGLLSAQGEGKLIVNMSTVSPDTSRYLSAACSRHQLHFLEAPVSGSVKPAQDGALIILVGGTAEDYNKALPFFDVLGKLALLLGPVGVGSSAKLAINYLLGLNLQGLAETVLFAEKNGVRTEDMLTIVNESACGNGITKIKTPAILAKSYPAAFALKHLVKDLRLAREAGLNAPLMQPLFDQYNQAYSNGLGEQDVMAIISQLEQKK